MRKETKEVREILNLRIQAFNEFNNSGDLLGAYVALKEFQRLICSFYDLDLINNNRFCELFEVFQYLADKYDLYSYRFKVR